MRAAARVTSRVRKVGPLRGDSKFKKMPLDTCMGDSWLKKMPLDACMGDSWFKKMPLDACIAIGHAVIDHGPVVVHLGGAVGRPRVQGCLFTQRDVMDIPVKFGRGGLVEHGRLLKARGPNGVE